MKVSITAMGILSLAAALPTQALPQVEIQINERSIIDSPDNPDDDYVTWAPSVGRARISGVAAATKVVLKSSKPTLYLSVLDPIDIGDVFECHVGSKTIAVGAEEFDVASVADLILEVWNSSPEPEFSKFKASRWQSGILLEPLLSDVPEVAVSTTEEDGADSSGQGFVASWSGEILLAGHPLPEVGEAVNAKTATLGSLELDLPPGVWKNFVLAGKFGRPSREDGDVQILATIGGAVVGAKPLMVRIRKDSNQLTKEERDRFLEALKAKQKAGGQSNYRMFAELHRLATSAGDEAHRHSGFLPWHRAVMLWFERDLQKIDPSVAIPFWNWELRSPQLFSEGFMGARPKPSFEGQTVGVPIFKSGNPLNGWPTDQPFMGGKIIRNIEEISGRDWRMPITNRFPDTVLLDNEPGSLVSRGTFGAYGEKKHFSRTIEDRSHAPAHLAYCSDGHIRKNSRAAFDPLFFLLHAQTDRQWAYWQWKNKRFGKIKNGAYTAPAPTHFANVGNFQANGQEMGACAEDTMWPWDGTSGEDPGGNNLKDRPPLQSAPGLEVPFPAPKIPADGFDQALISGQWPEKRRPIKVVEMIDYLGKLSPHDGFGYGYEDVPFR